MSELNPTGRRDLVLRIAGPVSVLLLGYIVAVFWLIFFGSATPYTFTDLDYYRSAVKVVVAQQPLYAALPYPPVAVLTIAWLGGFSVLQGNQLWTAMSLILVLSLAVVLAKRSMQTGGPPERLNRWELAVRTSVTGILLLISMPMDSQLANGQVTLLIISLAFLDVARVLPERFQGVLVGLAGAIKLTPMIFVPYYLVTGQRRQAAVATASFAAATGVGFLMFPADSLFFWSHLGKSDQFGDPTRIDNLSIHSMLVRWVPAIGNSAIVYGLLGLALAGFALWRARQHYQRGEWLSSALVVGAASVVMAPIAWPHYHVWVVLAGLWLLLAKRRLSMWLGLALFFAYSLQFTTLVRQGAKYGNPVADVAVELLVIIPILIGVFGLPQATEHPPVEPATNEATQVS